MQFDLIKTIFLLYGILSIAYSFSLILFLRSNPKIYVAIWTFGALTLGMAALLTIFRHEDNLLLTYIGANTLAFISNLLFAFSLHIVSGKSFNFSALCLKVIVLAVTYCFTLIAIGDYWGSQYQTIFVSSMMVITHFLAAYYAFEIEDHLKNKHVYALSAAFFLGGISWFVRILLVILGIGFNAFDTNIFNETLFTCIFVLGISRYFFFYGLLSEQENNEKLRTLHRFEAIANTLPGALFEFYLHPDHTPEFKYVSPIVEKMSGSSAASMIFPLSKPLIRFVAS